MPAMRSHPMPATDLLLEAGYQPIAPEVLAADEQPELILPFAQWLRLPAAAQDGFAILQAVIC